MAYGFIPVGGIDGRPYNGATVRCVVLGGVTDNIHIGDMVKLGGTGDAAGVPDVTKCTAAQVVFGSVVAVEPSTASSLPYAAGAVTTDQYVYVAPATDGVLFKCNPNAAGAKTSVGLACDMAISDGVAPYYTSKSSIDLSTSSTSAVLQIVGFVQDGVDVTSTSASMLVRVMEPQLGSGVVSVAV